MQFDPTIHTKKFLLSNPDVAFDLARDSEEFAKSDAAKDFDVLRLVNNVGETVAHRLAQCQSNWLHSDAAKDFDVLRLADKDGRTVAYRLAAYQSNWLHSDAAKDLDVLRLADKYGRTVAHRLAQYQSNWLHFDAAKDFDVLRLADEYGLTVAHRLAQYQSNCIDHEPLFHKQILTLEHQGKSLAEVISEYYKSDGFDVPVMAMKLISQGAAYKHSVPIDFGVGETILNHSKTLIEDSSEPLIALKQLQALYSTFSHNVNKVISTQDQKSLQKWQGLLLQSENLIRQHLANNPELLDIGHTVDIFCEPGDDLLKKLKSERVMSTNLASLNAISIEITSDQTTNTQSFY